MRLAVDLAQTDKGHAEEQHDLQMLYRVLVGLQAVVMRDVYANIGDEPGDGMGKKRLRERNGFGVGIL